MHIQTKPGFKNTIEGNFPLIFHSLVIWQITHFVNKLHYLKLPTLIALLILNLNIDISLIKVSLVTYWFSL